MSDDLELRDDRSFKSYRTDTHNQNGQEPLAKKQKLIMSVVRNDVTTLKTVLSPKWYRVTDKHGLNLLHIAMLQNSKEAFHYMLSLQDFPLEMVSNYGETPLITAILIIEVDSQGSDYFALELIKKGADVFFCDNAGYSTLSCTALKHHVKMAVLLVEKGVDLDLQDVSGNTPLHHALDHEGPNSLEFVSFLLYHGADPHITNKERLNPFEKSVFHSSTAIQEMLFSYTYDQYSVRKTQLSVILRLAKYQSPLVTQFDDFSIDYSYRGSIQLFYVDVEYLKLLLQKFKFLFGPVLQMCALYEWGRNAVTFEKIEVVLESNLKGDMIGCVQNVADDFLVLNELDEATITNIFCYLLSYGLNVTETGLQRIYQKFGYCDLFKILLHMDVRMGTYADRMIVPALLYDMSVDLSSFLDNCEEYSTENVDHLLGYFVNAKLNDLCCKLYGRNVSSRIRELPQVPLLVELARNAFRKYFIERFQIKTSKQFYTLINSLNVSTVYKKIVTFEKKLY